MGVKTLLSGIIVFLMIVLLSIYWFIPFQTIEFTSNDNSNFSLYNFGEEMQFYKNMRFPSKEISYNIDDECTLQKKSDMKRAFELIENVTILNFYPVENDEQITVNCDDKNKIEGGLFIAGEGGPVNITQTKNFNVITKGNIILIRDSNCPKPNVAIHELLHVLGFNHSANPNNIMYPISSCKQTIGDISNLINEIYIVESLPDLDIEKVSAVMNGKYLDLNISIRNNGLVKSENAIMTITSDETTIKEILIEPMEVGYGIQLTFSNIWVPKLNVEEIEFFIDASFNELDKNNNKKILKIKNNN